MPKGTLIRNGMEPRHLGSIKGPQGPLKEDLATYQLVGGVTAHQGYDG